MRLMHEYQHHFNLIPTPSPLSSFWLLLVCENGGGRSGNSCHVHVDVKTHGWGGQCPTENLKVLLVISCPRTRDCSVQKTVSIQLVVRLSWGWSRQSLWVATILLSVYLMSSHVVWSPRPSPSLRFCILQAIKNWNWERPGNEATPIHQWTIHEDQQ